MAPLTITNLRVHSSVSENPEPWSDVPYLVVNVVFRCERTTEDYDYAWNQAKAECEEYREVLTIDDPKRYEAWIASPDGWSISSKYDGYGRAWTHADPSWRYIEKFDCFWFREWIADCAPTRAIIAELEHYKEHGKLPSVYRSVDSCIILSHLETLQRYWD
jgi:hypothetical protein